VRAPFEEFAIVSKNEEPGAIFVTTYSKKEMTQHNPQGSEWIARQEWLFSVDVIMRGSSGFCLLTTTLCGVEGSGRSSTPSIEDQSLASAVVYRRALEANLGRLFVSADESFVHEGYRNAEALARVAAAVTMSLLCCRNIVTAEMAPTRQQRRAAQRAGLPLVSWHELVLRIPNAAHRAGSQAGEALALHWVRGHFKDYRQGGLFGQQRGVYWWSPHLAGQADRVVFKDYMVEAV